MGELQCLSLKLVVGASTNQMHCGFEKSKRRGKKQVYVENTVLPNVTL
jgi:hypothetical protein